MKRNLSLLAALALLCFLSPEPGLPQTTGTIEGTVTDSSGAVLSGVSVEGDRRHSFQPGATYRTPFRLTAGFSTYVRNSPPRNRAEYFNNGYNQEIFGSTPTTARSWSDRGHGCSASRCDCRSSRRPR